MLARGDTVTYLLRNTKALEDDEAVRPYIQSGLAVLIKGDATSQADVQNAWAAASKDGPVDFIMFTIGECVAPSLSTSDLEFSTPGQPNPKFHPIKGFIIDPPNLCTVSLLNTLRCVAATNVRPKLVILTSTGVTSHSHSVLPLPMKALYGYLLRQTLQDKRGIETLLYHGLGKEYEAGQTPGPHILPAGWEKDLPSPGWLRSGVVIRAALLTDGPMTGTYRAAVNDFPCYRVSRADVGHFIAGGLLNEWAKWEGNVVCVGY